MSGWRPDNAPQSRVVSDRGQDDTVLPFAVERLDVRGRIVRLGPSVDEILKRHAYPPAVARILGEALALTVMLGSSLKIAGRFQLQTRGDGPVDMVVVDFDAPDRLRAFARFDAARLSQAPSGADLLGAGHLAFTIDQGAEAARYQGVVALTGQGLEEAAHQYFRQSEQIPTQVRLAVAQHVTTEGVSWRAGGLLVQFLPSASERRGPIDLPPGDAPASAAYEPPREDDAWTEAKALVGTVEDHELVDPTLSSERLLYRLFHEPGVKVFEPQGVRDACRCSDESVRNMLLGFSPQEREEMVGDDGRIGVTCEFCSTFRAFDPSDLG
ncbi:Hsp33 protein [Methylocella silvestris BL2]|uniref:Hsp33 protein n=1 Tax=Methylocella silvestris (strain DSM 15510 / CIP 108128 / LMG 27833 / NCIMB 13906 / BL2) TaxID=395965 RepID=B8ER55_METSB|nr:Hsp33 family molecular chaperone [Methylocella silvestris]ACK49800.1 Hsp33 protein [Methylocella silvestris BL2]